MKRILDLCCFIHDSGIEEEYYRLMGETMCRIDTYRTGIPAILFNFGKYADPDSYGLVRVYENLTSMNFVTRLALTPEVEQDAQRFLLDFHRMYVQQ